MSSSARFFTKVRHELRTPVVLPVKIFTGDLEMAQWSCTYEVSRRGARLKQVPGVLAKGQHIWIKRHNSKARYRVAWIGGPGGGQPGQFAVECLDETFIWDAELTYRLSGPRD